MPHARVSSRPARAPAAPRVTSDRHFSVPLNRFIPDFLPFLSYSVPVFLKWQSDSSPTAPCSSARRSIARRTWPRDKVKPTGLAQNLQVDPAVLTENSYLQSVKVDPGSGSALWISGSVADPIAPCHPHARVPTPSKVDRRDRRRSARAGGAGPRARGAARSAARSRRGRRGLAINESFRRALLYFISD